MFPLQSSSSLLLITLIEITLITYFLDTVIKNPEKELSVVSKLISSDSTNVSLKLNGYVFALSIN